MLGHSSLFPCRAQSLIPSALDALLRPCFIYPSIVGPQMTMATMRFGCTPSGSSQQSFFASRMLRNVITSFSFVDNFFHRKSRLHAVYDRISLYADRFSKCGSNVLNTANLYKSRCPLILGLLRTGSPSAISNSVRSVIINPIQAQPRRSVTNIAKESRKGISPAVANSYSSAPVIGKLRVFGVEASLLHIYPSLVKRVGAFEWHKVLQGSATPIDDRSYRSKRYA